jgi:ABC-type sugar transport system permease subunit
LVYLRAFSSNNLGSGAALAVVLFFFIGLMTLLQNRVFKLQKDD